MPATINKFLNLIELSQLDNWSVQTLLDSTVNYSNNFELAKIGEFLIKNRTIIDVKDDIEYRRVTVKINNNGVLLRDIEKGINIGTKKQYLAKAGQFIVSRIDARNGAFGIIPKDLDGAIVTNDFPLFDVNQEKINPQFLLLITSTKEFIKFAQSCSSGTTNRQRMDIDMFLNQKIPLPKLEEQSVIIESYNKRTNTALELHIKAKDVEKKIATYFSEKLGIVETEKIEFKNGLQLLEFKNLDRWDTWVSKVTLSNQKYKPTPLRKVIIGKPVYGANVKGIKTKSETRYIRITDINENGNLNDEFVSPEVVDEKYLLKENDFLIARSGNTVGKTFLFKEILGRAMYAGYLVKYNIDFSQIMPEYLFEYTKSYTFKKWISSNQRIAGQPNINGQEYLEAPIIIPPLREQAEIVQTISAMKKKIEKLYCESDNLKSKAIVDFEKTIFN